MKTTLFSTALLATSLPLLAVPRPEVAPQVAPVPPAVVAEAAPPVRELGDPKNLGVGFLGVSAHQVPQDDARKHNIEGGVSLLSVQVGSPAAKAGLGVGDIITHVGETKVGSMVELRDAIREHKEGEKVPLKVVQKGQAGEVMATLGGVPNFAAGAAAGGIGLRMVPGAGVAGGMRLNFAGRGAFQLGDAEGSIELKGRGEAREVTVRDHDEEIVYEGPWVTPQDKAAAPADIKERIDRLVGMFGEDDAFGMLDMGIPEAPQIVPQQRRLIPPGMKMPLQPGILPIRPAEPVLPEGIDEQELPRR